MCHRLKLNFGRLNHYSFWLFICATIVQNFTPPHHKRVVHVALRKNACPLLTTPEEDTTKLAIINRLWPNSRINSNLDVSFLSSFILTNQPSWVHVRGLTSLVQAYRLWGDVHICHQPLWGLGQRGVGNWQLTASRWSWCCVCVRYMTNPISQAAVGHSYQSSLVYMMRMNKLVQADRPWIGPDKLIAAICNQLIAAIGNHLIAAIGRW